MKGKQAKASPKSETKKTLPTKPNIGYEYSRKEVMCISGKGGPGSTVAMKIADLGGRKKANANTQ